jgi:methyl-accepting chemotaxis protein
MILLPALVCFSLSDVIVLRMALGAQNAQEATAGSLITLNLLLFGASFVVLLIAVLLAAGSVIRPIRLLTGYTLKLADGNTDFKVASTGRGDEFGELGRSIRGAQITLKKVTLILGRASGDILVGNLSVRADAAKYPGDFGRIMDNNNKVNDSICDVIRSIKTAAENVAAVSTQISAGSQSVAYGATEQASAIEEVSRTIGDFLVRTKDNSENADKTRRLTEKISDEARKGSKKMLQLSGALEAISTSSSYISNVIKLIEDIAFQTNILALNASVEAARAGIHGKGFQVVAEEVKNLAGKSAAAAKESSELLGDSISKSKRGIVIGEEMESVLTEIVRSIDSAVTSISGIAEDCAQQVAIIEQVNSGLGQISQVVQNNTATAEESAAASEEMAAQSTLLMDMVAGYRIEVERVVATPTGFKESDW